MSERSGATTKKSKDCNDARQLITIVVPTRNEAANIGPLLDKIAEALAPLDVEVLFVDDSDDETADQIRSARSRFKFPVHLIARPIEKRNGLSGAVVDGLHAALGEWVCVMDADLQHPPETIWRMWEQVNKSGADIVVGSRRGDWVGPLGLTKMRSLTSKTLTIFARMLFPRALRNVSDPLTGLFLVKRSRIDMNALRPDGFKILLEILVRCPDLHVTEIHFDFAPRHKGHSKADVREGIRFFRHLVRLRTTVNPHLIRFVVTIVIGLVGNIVLLAALTEQAGFSFYWSAVIAVEMLALWIILLFDRWVFHDRLQDERGGSSWRKFLRAQLVLLFVFLPVLYVLAFWLGLSYPVANWVALLVTGFMLYVLSEQWVWTGRSMVWQARVFNYNIHNILRIESEVQLDELAYFAAREPVEDVDIQIRLDRQGTPSQLPGGISYDEHLGRFGFGMTVLPGDYFQIIVSPLLARSPGFLYTNIVEPVLRWRLVAKGYALVKAASVSSDNLAVLIHAQRDLGETVAVLCQKFGYRFMADDLTILGTDGKVYSYPKPVTISQRMLQYSALDLRMRDRLSQALQRSLYTRFARRLGLWLSARNLPAATLNTYLQWLIPQPKDMLGDVLEGMEYADVADCSLIAEAVGVGEHSAQDLAPGVVQALQQGDSNVSFQPHPLLAKQLRFRDGDDLMKRERTIIENTVESVSARRFAIEEKGWWVDLARRIQEEHRPRSFSLDVSSDVHDAATLGDA